MTRQRRKGLLLATVASACWVLSLGLLVAFFVLDSTMFLMAYLAVLLALPAIVGVGLFRLIRPVLRQRTVRASQLNSATRNIAAMSAALNRLSALEDRIESMPGSIALQAPDASELAAINDSLRSLGEAQALPLRSYMSVVQAVSQIRAALRVERPLEALPWLKEFDDALANLTLSECRALAKYFRRVGYLEQSVIIIEHIAELFGKESDRRAAVLYRTELELYRGSPFERPELPPFQADIASKTVLHLVGKALPDTQSGYTLRTQYTVEAQQRVGLEPVVVGQVGASDHRHERTETYVHAGVRYYLLGGPQRGEVGWDDWLRRNVEQLAEVVRLTKPAVLHAHSDFMNSMIAQVVGDAYGIPVVNETRGFWEESWLSRTANEEGWNDLDLIRQRYGLPEMYTLRVEREAHARHKADYVLTLAGVMDRHIRKVAFDAGMPVDRLALAPNAVHAEDFPVLPRSEKVLVEHGIPVDAVVIGYISSMVEYEGVDTLLQAIFLLNEARKASSVADQGTGEIAIDAIEGDGEAQSAQATVPDTGSRRSVATVPIAAAPDAVTSMRDSLHRASEFYGSAGTVLADPELTIAVPPASTMSPLIEAMRSFRPDATADDHRENAQRLVDAARSLGAAPIHLLLVGGGAHLDHLRQLAEGLEIANVTFTGRVPHESVLDYYSGIDLFVIPRKPVAVTRLVTPLKPFEALSTGRPGLFSDVEALAEIARESGGAATFRAGDASDLALRIADLLLDPDRLAEMSAAGAKWVRSERTWDLNAYEYMRVYRELGMALDVPEFVDAGLRLRAQGVDAVDVIQRLSKGETPRMGGWFSLAEKKRTTGPGGDADTIRRMGWTGDRHEPVHFVPGMDWDALSRENRSWGFKLHAWDFMDAVLSEYVEAHDDELLEWVVNVVAGWCEYASKPLPPDSMAWYDMSMSLRMPRLARFMIVLSKSHLASETSRFIGVAIEHIERSMEEGAFNPNNNHGIYCALAQCDFAKWLPMIPGAAGAKTQGQERLGLMLERQFAADGGHLEHSPDYHRMLLASCEKAIQDGLIDDERIEGRIARAAYVMGWMVQPDGYLVQFGDSPQKKIARGSLDEHTRYIATDGAAGSPDDAQMLVLPESGYAFVRSPQPSAPGDRQASSYLAFMAAFHSRAHKHADDMTFTWFDRGRELLVDSGRFGYVNLLPADSPDRLKGFYYSAPQRQYVESTMAHNTVAVDGRDIERRTREPYGSSLGDCTNDGNEFVLRGRVDHVGYVHERELKFVPGEKLTVIDRLISTGKVEEAVAWFNMDGELALSVDNGRVRVSLPGSDEKLWVASSGELVEPVLGQQSPMRGWRSKMDRQVEPVWNFGFRVAVGADTQIVTVFEFDASSRSTR